MNRLIFATAVILAGATASFAAGSHAGGHADEMAIGMAGDAKKAKRTVTITMKETGDGKMVFEPKNLQVRRGETIRLKFLNKGEGDHEFVMDTQEAVMEHKALMEKFPDMEHADPNSVRLAPGTRGEIIWTFANDGDFTFACLIPGHYEAGMHGAISVAK